MRHLEQTSEAMFILLALLSGSRDSIVASMRGCRPDEHNHVTVACRLVKLEAKSFTLMPLPP